MQDGKELTSVKPQTIEGVMFPANYSFEAVNEFVHHIDVGFEELQWAMLGMATEREAIQQQLADARLLARAAMRTYAVSKCAGGITISRFEDDTEVFYPCNFDPDGLPILTDEVRKALQKAVGE